MDCVFCKIANGELPSRVVYQDNLVMVIMDTSPTVDGHALVIPKKHYTDYKELDADIQNHILKIGDEIGTKIMGKLNSKGFTFLVNYGDRQLVKHFHLHILPDYGPETVYKLKRSIDENFELIMK